MAKKGEARGHAMGKGLADFAALTLKGGVGGNGGLILRDLGGQHVLAPFST